MKGRVPFRSKQLSSAISDPAIVTAEGKNVDGTPSIESTLEVFKVRVTDENAQAATAVATAVATAAAAEVTNTEKHKKSLKGVSAVGEMKYAAMLYALAAEQGTVTPYIYDAIITLI